MAPTQEIDQIMKQDIRLSSPYSKQDQKRYDQASTAALRAVGDVSHKSWQRLHKIIYHDEICGGSPLSDGLKAPRQILRMLRDKLMQLYKETKVICVKDHVKYITVPLHGPYTFHFSPRSMISKIRIYPDGWIYSVNAKNGWSARHKIHTDYTEINSLYWIQSQYTQGGPYVGATQNFIALCLPKSRRQHLLSAADKTLTKKGGYRGNKVYAIESLQLIGLGAIWEQISNSSQVYKCSKIETLYLLYDAYRFNGRSIRRIPMTVKAPSFYRYVIAHNCHVYGFMINESNLKKHWDRDIKTIQAAFQNRLK